MKRDVIIGSGGPHPASHYHHGLLFTGATRQLFLAGQIGEAEDGQVLEGFENQAKAAWSSIHRLLREAGMDVNNLAQLTVYLVNRSDIPAYEAVHARQVGDSKPPWTLVMAQGLGKAEYLLEIQATAVA